MLFRQLLFNFQNEDFDLLKQLISSHIREESKLKSNAIETRNQLCFAVIFFFK